MTGIPREYEVTWPGFISTWDGNKCSGPTNGIGRIILLRVQLDFYGHLKQQTVNTPVISVKQQEAELS